jgi:hypothetical protein
MSETITTLDAIRTRAKAYAEHGTPGLRAPQDRAYLLAIIDAQQAKLDAIEADTKAMRAREDRLHPFRAHPMCPCKICKPESVA